MRETPKPRRFARPGLLLAAALLVVTTAGFSARAALAAPADHRYLTSARSVQLLRIAFASVAERPLREPRVVIAPTSMATWGLSDDVNIANHAWNPRTARPWSPGDARSMWPEGMGGFTDPVSTTVYINASTAVESNVAHELLHANASPEFLLTVGVAVNEGVTEQLALDALAISGVRAEKAPAYPQERALAAAIMRIVGRDRLVQAYFNGGQYLADFVDAMGADTLTKVKNAAATNNLTAAVAAVEAASVRP